jgi:hypothetical protein
MDFPGASRRVGREKAQKARKSGGGFSSRLVSFFATIGFGQSGSPLGLHICVIHFEIETGR